MKNTKVRLILTKELHINESGVLRLIKFMDITLGELSKMSLERVAQYIIDLKQKRLSELGHSVKRSLTKADLSTHIPHGKLDPINPLSSILTPKFSV